MIQAHLITETIISNSTEAFTLNDKSCFGEKKKNRIEYSFIEALYLLEAGKITIFSNNKTISYEQLLKKAQKSDKKIITKIAVYTNLRKSGYIVKTALKFGAEFRVYDKGIKPGQDHAAWLLYPVKESETHSWYNFAAKNRVAHAAKKKLLLGIVDDEDDVTYYQVSWFRP